MPFMVIAVLWSKVTKMRAPIERSGRYTKGHVHVLVGGLPTSRSSWLYRCILQTAHSRANTGVMDVINGILMCYNSTYINKTHNHLGTCLVFRPNRFSKKN